MDMSPLGINSPPQTFVAGGGTSFEKVPLRIFSLASLAEEALATLARVQNTPQKFSARFARGGATHRYDRAGATQNEHAFISKREKDITYPHKLVSLPSLQNNYQVHLSVWLASASNKTFHEINTGMLYV